MQPFYSSLQSILRPAALTVRRHEANSAISVLFPLVYRQFTARGAHRKATRSQQCNFAPVPPSCTTILLPAALTVRRHEANSAISLLFPFVYKHFTARSAHRKAARSQQCSFAPVPPLWINIFTARSAHRKAARSQQCNIAPVPPLCINILRPAALTIRRHEANSAISLLLPLCVSFFSGPQRSP